MRLGSLLLSAWPLRLDQTAGGKPRPYDGALLDWCHQAVGGKPRPYDDAFLDWRYLAVGDKPRPYDDAFLDS